MSNKENCIELKFNKKKMMDSFDSAYGYRTMLGDSSYPAIYSGVGLATGINEVMTQFELLYGNLCSFKDALVYYGKTIDEFKKDVVQEFIRQKRRIRREKK